MSGEAPDALAAWRAMLAEPELTALPADPSVAQIAALRGRFATPVVAAALEWARARPKAEAKWPGRRFVCDVPGIEMATGATIARHKAERIAEPSNTVIDLCAGIGGDLVSFADQRADCEGVELDPLRAWMASENSGRPVRTADAQRVDLTGTIAHLDPARRDRGGRRTVRFADLIPGPEFIERVTREAAGAAIKLMPGIDADQLPEGELEYISEGGALKQAVLWSGALRGDARVRATMLRDGEALSLIGAVDAELPPPPHRDIGRWVFTADPAVERAGLLGVLCARLGLGMPHPRGGLLAADGPVSSPWVRAFEVIEVLPWTRRRVRAVVRAAAGGLVEVKTRGGVIDADAEARALRGNGAETLTVFVVRLGSAGIRAVITRRASSVHPDGR